TWFLGRGCSATQASKNPSNDQVRREAAAAGKWRPIRRRRNPTEIRTKAPMKQLERRGTEAARETTAGCRATALRQANDAAIATAGSLMALAATLPGSRCGMSAGTDRTNAFR